MSRIVVVDGIPAVDTTIPWLNRAFLYGDAAFEVLRTDRRGRAYLAEPHLARLERSAMALDIPWPGERAFAEDLDHLTAQSWRVRLMIFGDALGLGETSEKTHRVLIAEAIEEPSDGLSGVAVSGEGQVTLISGCKVASYAASAAWTRRAKRAAADEVFLFCDARLLEGATSNVLLIEEGQLIFAEGSDVLPGVTQQRVLELAAAEGLRICRRASTSSMVLDADECVITSAIRGVLPITHLDGHPIGSGSVGATGRRLRELYLQDLHRD